MAWDDSIDIACKTSKSRPVQDSREFAASQISISRLQLPTQEVSNQTSASAAFPYCYLD